MSKGIVLAALMGWVCGACAATPVRFPGRYDGATHVYVNEAAGFRLALPQHWAVITTPQGFTVQHALRPDQEKVLEAYDARSGLGLVIVVQQGPLIDIADFVRRMQRVPEEHLRRDLQSPQATDVRQYTIRQIRVDGYEAAEWTYAALDTTAGQPEDVTVSSYIVQVKWNYVYVTFAVPSDLYQDARGTMASILSTFGPAKEA
jgi:hypothetical protein